MVAYAVSADSGNTKGMIALPKVWFELFYTPISIRETPLQYDDRFIRI